VRSGVGRTIVSLWPVDDWVAPVVMSSLYSGLAEGLAPAHALAEAQRTIHRRSAEQLRAAYVELGGDPAQDASQRRGLDLDPGLRDEEEIPDPLSGDAERYWAPFVVVG
jgi:CHAT domain-containing protein